MNLISIDNLLERVRELTKIAKPTAGEVWELQELVNRLDDSLSEGGVYPTRWVRRRGAVMPRWIRKSGEEVPVEQGQWVGRDKPFCE